MNRLAYRTVAISFLILVIPFVIQAQDQQEVLTLEDAIRIGLEQNYSIQIAENEADIAGNNADLGNAGFLPSLNANGSYSGRVENTKQAFASNDIPDRTTDGAESASLQAGASLNWTIFDGLKMFTTYEKLQELKQLGDVQARVQIESTVSTIIRTYSNIVQQQKTLDLLESTLNVSQQRIDIAQTKLDLGSGSRYELLQARADYNADKAAVIRQQTQLEDAKIQLNNLLSRDPTTAYNVTDAFQIDSGMARDELINQAMQNNAGLIRARTNATVADLNLEEIKAERYPEIGLQFGYGYNRNESGGGFIEFNQSSGINYGITATFNLFDGFDVSRRTQNARIQQRNTDLALEDARQQVQAQIASTYQQYEQSLNLITLEEENLQYAKESLEIALERFEQGSINSIELREAQRTYQAAENRLINAQYEAKITETELRRLGGFLVE